jgi:hypothetical protein
LGGKWEGRREKKAAVRDAGESMHRGSVVEDLERGVVQVQRKADTVQNY